MMLKGRSVGVIVGIFVIGGCRVSESRLAYSQLGLTPTTYAEAYEGEGGLQWRVVQDISTPMNAGIAEAAVADQNAIPSLPTLYGSLTTVVYGSIHTTAYYFTDLLLGGNELSRQSLILDTGSSIMAFACASCSKCGVHLDSPYSCKVDPTCQALPCTADCRYCDSSRDRCAYRVAYMEGSSLQGFWYKAPVSFLDISREELGALATQVKERRRTEADNTTEGLPQEIRSISLDASDQIGISFGCHIEETHLFTTQKAAGILGLEASYDSHPDTFITELLANDCTAGDPTCQPKFDEKRFSLCLALKGGLFTIGGAAYDFHRAAIATPPVGNEAPVVPPGIIWTPLIPNKRSYAVQVLAIHVGTEKVYPLTYLKMEKDLGIVENDADGSDDRRIQESLDALSLTERYEDVPSVVANKLPLTALVDSGTTITYLPSMINDLIKEHISIALERSARNLRHLRLVVEDADAQSIDDLYTLGEDPFDVLRSAPKRRSPVTIGAMDQNETGAEGLGSEARPSAALRRAAAIKLKSRSQEECWYLSDAVDDLVAFPNIYVTFAPMEYQQIIVSETADSVSDDAATLSSMVRSTKVTWSPESYLYPKGSSNYRCLGIAGDDGNGAPSLPEITNISNGFRPTPIPDIDDSPHIVLGSSFFIGHDVIFDVDPRNVRKIGVANASCPSNVFDNREYLSGAWADQ